MQKHRCCCASWSAGETNLRSSMFLLESERLLFRDHEPADFEAYYALEADPEVRRYVGGEPRTRQKAKHKFRDSILKGVSLPLGLRAAILKSEGRYIGYAGI